MPAPLSYLVAILVILGLLAIFAIIVRRVAAHGPNPENGRGRGPRLGLVDTFSLDKDRQLVIVRRDNVEHLLMIGGTNDVVVETNIVRAMSANAVRDTSFMTATHEPSVLPAALPVEPSFAPAPLAPAPMPPLAPTAPRLRPSQPVAQSQTPPVSRMPLDHDAGAPIASQPAPSYPTHDLSNQDDDQQSLAPVSDPNANPALTAAQRSSFNQSELIALAKRLEASIPSTGAPKTEKPAPTPAPVQMPQVSLSAPITPPPITPPVEQPLQPASVSLKPQAQPQPSFAPDINMVPLTPASQSRPATARPTMMPQMRPTMQPPVAPPMPQPEPISAPPSFEAEQMAMPMPEPVPVMPPPQVQPAPAPVVPELPKDRQAAALDENLRRLLGRKVEPRQ